MSDWRSVPAIVTDTFGVSDLSGGLRIVFGQRIDEPFFHSAIQIDREGARLLVVLLQKALGSQGAARPEAGQGGGSGGPSIIMGSTSVH